MASRLITNATENVTDVLGIFNYIHNDVYSNFFALILLGLYILIFLLVRSYSISNSKPFATSCFIGMIISIILRTLGFLSTGYMYLSITLVGVAVVWLYIDKT